MAAGDVVISSPAVTAVPAAYTVPGAQEIIPKVVTATIDGTAAGGTFLPTLQIIAPGGAVVARCPTSTQIAAGGTAEVSWFRILNAQSAVTGSGYSNLILSAGPSAYWKQDELSAVGAFPMKDSSGHGRDGYYNGSAFMIFGVPPLAAQTANTYVAAHATRGEIDNSTPPNQPNSARHIANKNFSVVACIKTTIVAGFPSVVSSSDLGGGGSSWMSISVDTFGHVSFLVFDNLGNGTTKTGAVNVADGVAHHIVGTFGADNKVWAYVDGVADGASVAGPATHAGPAQVNKITIGDRFHGVDSNFFDGTIDEVAIYQYALSAAQVAAHFAARLT